MQSTRTHWHRHLTSSSEALTLFGQKQVYASQRFFGRAWLGPEPAFLNIMRISLENETWDFLSQLLGTSRTPNLVLVFYDSWSCHSLCDPLTSFIVRSLFEDPFSSQKRYILSSDGIYHCVPNILLEDIHALLQDALPLPWPRYSHCQGLRRLAVAESFKLPPGVRGLAQSFAKSSAAGDYSISMLMRKTSRMRNMVGAAHT